MFGSTSSDMVHFDILYNNFILDRCARKAHHDARPRIDISFKISKISYC